MRLALTAALLGGLCAFGLARRAQALRLPPRLPPACALRVDVHGPAGFDALSCGADVDATLRAAGRPDGCPALGALRDGAKLTVAGQGGCEVTVGRMAGPALRLLRLPIDINLSSVEDLQALPGIGPELALRVVAGRPYRTIAELRKVAGFGPKRVMALAGATEIAAARPQRVEAEEQGPTPERRKPALPADGTRPKGRGPQKEF
jgi:hypothetical protein